MTKSTAHMSARVPFVLPTVIAALVCMALVSAERANSQPARTAEMAVAANLPPGSRSYRLRRLQQHDGEPWHLPGQATPAILIASLLSLRMAREESRRTPYLRVRRNSALDTGR